MELPICPNSMALCGSDCMEKSSMHTHHHTIDTKVMHLLLNKSHVNIDGIEFTSKKLAHVYTV